ncbi:PolC-type DNA polymerase III [Acidaminobacter hydrogenoformans]|uniref:DNA polymerase III PolC-type n=1 Tax=Acidaminobacter hydrogenoformans DSM 2784 TaxID=1120920 RepID=A0A1G5RSS4_9FIRM|nr:PolC-type DNA polymerase III [Acidaminobacter hydrogenoformans]SCZ76860.1 DNA polymerase III catalytic subunit, PolC type [Acidaminobacter hydrogenoformans DSM 2784]
MSIQNWLMEQFGETIRLERVALSKKPESLKLQLAAGYFPEPEKLEAFLDRVQKAIPEVCSLDWVCAVEAPVSPEDEAAQSNERLHWAMYWLKQQAPSAAAFLKKEAFVRQNEIQYCLHIPDQVTSEHLSSRKILEVLENNFDSHFGVSFKLTPIYDVEGCKVASDALDSKKESDLKTFMASVPVNAPKSAPKPQAKNQWKNSEPQDDSVLYRFKIKRPITSMVELAEEEGTYAVEAEVLTLQTRDLKTGKVLLNLSISDRTSSLGAKLFLKSAKESQTLLEKLKVGGWYKFEGTLRYDTFDKEMALYLNNINVGEAPLKRRDEAPVKRVELHCHTNMSDMDGISSVKSLIKRAMDWGHKAIAVTDHGVLQAFPEAMETARGKDIKIIYGMEGYLIDDEVKIVRSSKGQTLEADFVVFDIETTGLNPKHDKIIEIAAVRIEGGQITETFSALVDPHEPLSEKIKELTGIEDEQLTGQPGIEEILPRFLEFARGAVLVAHNAGFDTGFVREACSQLGYPYDMTSVDTLGLSRLLLKDLKRHRLNMVAKHLGVKLENHHRALDDATATAEVFLKLVARLREEGVSDLNGLTRFASANMSHTMMDSHHIIILVKNLKGLKALYQLVTHAHMKTFYKKPRIPRSLLEEHKDNLILGSACESGELFKALVENRSEEDVEKIAGFYDFLEIQPLGNNQFMIDKGLVQNQEALKVINRKIVDLGGRLGKTVAATCDVHFLEPEDEVYRRILMAGQGYDDAENQPPLYLRTTAEMLQEFDYLGEKTAYEVVVEATNKIADQVDSIMPIPDETFPPIIEGSDEDLRRLCVDKAVRLYGSPLPELVDKRLERELNSIISNGYAVMYIIAHKLVKKSMEDGYLVGSRGSVGSSLAATMCDITEVNPLPPHYLCPSCKFSEFMTEAGDISGADLPDRDCPKCGSKLDKDGHDIPFETFLGFEGDKEPDIDLNFAGVYQATAHKYTEELFGKGYVYKAGTIGTIADKTAYGFVKKYFEEKNLTVNSREIERLASGCTGIKRTTGQHPGGIMVVPSYKDIHDFCPIQFPANDMKSDVVTTHFDYHSISGRILKLDILGHDVPTMIKQLEEMTKLDVLKIPLDDPATLRIFTSNETLGIVDPEYKSETGSLGIPEFGTKFVRQMLVDTQPTTLAELVRISGLSHGTDVWVNNAQTLVRNGIADLKHVISTRDDIMNYLIQKGLPPKQAFTIMERVRKGKGLTEENESLMREFDVPDWYINSCNTIQYMFPKAHAVAYVTMSFRIAYFKVHHPLAFYASYFSSKVEDFDAQLICQGKRAVREKKRWMEENWDVLTKKEQDLYGIMELVDEYYSRGFDFHKVDLYKSEANAFIEENGMLRPPLQSLQGVGDNAAQKIVEERFHGEYLSLEDLKSRAKATKTVVDALVLHGAVQEMPERNQLSLF